MTTISDTGPAGTPPDDERLVIRTAADLQVGDYLNHWEGYSNKVTRLNPATREKALECGYREVWSGGAWVSLLAEEPVNASAGEARLARLAEQDGQVGA